MLSHPPHLRAHQSISPLAQPQGSLMLSAPTHTVLARSVPLPLLCQLYLQLTCPPPLTGPSSQQDPGVELLTPSWSLGLSLHGTHLLSISPLRCPSLFRNGPASFWSAWWESHHRPSFLSKIPPNWEDMGSEYNYAIYWKCIVCFLLYKCFICINLFHLYNNPT